MNLLQQALEQKERLRKRLRELPIEKKLQMIALMQRRANEIRRAVGRPEQPEWPLEAVGLE